ncbi:hypothetical protein [Kineococcus sp. SYSU DK001]|uniref:hypothetical protein n=1 Tax=Kineococcus sp. SYSU DK001 TaxID=3383122 RepID=UPI003D7C556D
MISRLFRTVAAVRGAKALHPRGTVLPGTLRRHGLHPGTGVRWVDEPGEDRVVVRFSRATGLPAPLPDVLGLALRVELADGPGDLLLSTTLGRRVPWPRRDARHGLHSSIAAFRAPSGRLLVGARHVGGRYLLAVAAPRGPWRPFAELHLDPGDAGDAGDAGDGHDEPLTFEPVRHAVPGLTVPAGWRRLREPAYSGSRRGRR